MSITIKSTRFKGKTYESCSECGKRGVEWVTASDFVDGYWVEFKQCRYCGHVLPEQKKFDFGSRGRDGEGWVKGTYRICDCHKCRIERGECHCWECSEA